MSGQMQQDAAGLKKASQDIMDANTALSNLIKKLDADIMGRTQDWQGQGGAAFFQLFESWRDENQKVVGALVNFHNNIDATHKVTAQADQEQNANVAAIAKKLGA